jgi:tetratricopeptide (TPR) repeat protein
MAPMGRKSPRRQFLRLFLPFRRPLGLLFATAALICLVPGCATVDPRAEADFGLKNLADGDIALGIIALVNEYVGDPYSRSFLYSRLADEYQKRGQTRQAIIAIRRAERVSRSDAARGQRHQLLVELAGYYIAYGQNDKAHQLLREALDKVLTIEKEAERGQALENIILLCFKVSDVFNDILRVAIDNVYALYDPELRVSLLSELGQKYQESNSGNRATVFIQQSLASAASIANPWSRSLAYARIGSRYIHEDNNEAGQGYLEQAVREADGVDILSLGSVDAQNILNTVIILAENGRYSDATTILNRFPSAGQRANAMLAVAERYLKQKSQLPARLLVQRLLNQLAQDDPESRQELSLATLVRLAEIYADAGLNAESARYIQAALAGLGSPQIANVSEYRARLALAMAKIKQLNNAMASVNLITDDYIASQTLRQIADSFGLPKLLLAAETQARQATYLRESAMSAVAVSWWHAGDYRRALKIFAEIKDAYTLTSALLEAVARHGEEPAGPMDSDTENGLRDIAKRWYDRPVPSRQ